MCVKLSKALHIASRNQGVNLQVHICNKIQDLLDSDLHSQINFVVFGIDARNLNCLNKVKDNIKQLENFLKFGRMCFVNGYNVKPAEMAVTYNSIWELSIAYNVHLIKGNVEVESKCLYLADRILRLAALTVGVKTGIPFIECPFRGTP
ncbi:hypothetical protein C0J52_15602 [Blattella germanica]|nr:hypothetical protein C0J52_15602 [Blattella germanica]